MTYNAKVIAGGKIVMPSELLQEFGIKDGDSLIVERDDQGGLSLRTFEQALRESQRRARAVFGADYTVDQFIAEKRADWGEA